MLTRGAIQALGEGAQGEYTVQVVNIELGDLQKGEPNRLVISDGETSRTALLASPLSPFHVIQIQEYSRNPQGEYVHVLSSNCFHSTNLSSWQSGDWEIQDRTTAHEAAQLFQ